MKKVKVKIENEQGLHARPARMFVNEAKRYSCDVKIQYNDKEINGKSILELLSLGICCGKQINIITNGIDEEKASQELVDLLEHMEE